MCKLKVYPDNMCRRVLAPYITLFCQIFRKEGCRCENLTTYRVCSKIMNELHNKLGFSRQTNIVNEFEMLVDYLGGFKGWTGRYEVRIFPGAFSSLRPLVQLVENWFLCHATELHKIIQFKILEPELVDFRLSLHEFMTEFQQIQGFEMNEKEGKAEITGDDVKVLSIEYKPRIIYIKTVFAMNAVR